MMILDRFAMPSAKIRKGQVIRPFQSSRRWLAPPEHEETREYQGFEAADIVVRRTVTIYDRGYVGRYYLICSSSHGEEEAYGRPIRQAG